MRGKLASAVRRGADGKGSDNRDLAGGLPNSLYEAFPPEEARRILDRLELHHTPKHGSWPGALGAMAEIELSVLGRQCLDRGIADDATLRREIAAWEAPRNRAEATMDWRFTTADARIKLKHLYPVTTVPAQLVAAATSAQPHELSA